MTTSTLAAPRGDRYYITTAIEYANGDPHLGHALEKIGADAIARYHRLCGDDVRLLVGTDEHGQKVALAAAANGITPSEQAEKTTAAFRATWDRLGVSYTEFSHTTNPRHVAGVLALITRILERDPSAFYERSYEGLYCVGCESFKTEHDLADGACPLHPGRALERVTETNWFFRLSAYQDFIARFLADHPDFVQPASRRNEVLALVERGLEDVSITRANLEWGIPFPLASRDGTHQAHLRLVRRAAELPYGGWISRPGIRDALAGAGTRRRQGHHSISLRAVARDVCTRPVYHCPSTFGFTDSSRLTGSGSARARACGSISVTAIDRFGPDALRYYLLREIPFDGDGDFSWRRFDARYTGDLANTLGNLVSRVTALVAQHYVGGVVPSRHRIDERQRTRPRGPRVSGAQKLSRSVRVEPAAPRARSGVPRACRGE